MDDYLQRLAESFGIMIKPKTVFVEGDSDIGLFELAARLEKKATGADLLEGLAIVSAGTGDEGGVRAVAEKLVSYSLMGQQILLSNGNRKYRFVALLDNDMAGRGAVKTIQSLNPGLLLFRDIFLLHPVFPVTSNFDPPGLGREFDRENHDWKGLDWEVEDLVAPTLFEAFIQERPGAVKKVVVRGGKQHMELALHAKGAFHKFVRDHAIRNDLDGVVNVLRALRAYLRLPTSGQA